MIHLSSSAPCLAPHWEANTSCVSLFSFLQFKSIHHPSRELGLEQVSTVSVKMALGMLLQTSFTAFLKKKARSSSLSDNFSEIFPAFTRVLWEHLFSFVLEAVRALSTLLAFVPKTGRAMHGHVDIDSLATRVSLAATSSCMCGIHSCFSPRSGIVHAMVQTTVPSPNFLFV